MENIYVDKVKDAGFEKECKDIFPFRVQDKQCTH